MGPCADFDYPTRRDFVVSLLGEYALNRSAIRAFTCLLTLPSVLLLFGFADTEPRQQKVLIAEMPLYLEEHLDAARIEDCKVPEDVLKTVEWRFDEAQPNWKVAGPRYSDGEPARLVRIEDALRIILTQVNRPDGKGGRREAHIYVDLPDWQWEDWAYVVVHARAPGEINRLALDFNLHKGPSESGRPRVFAVYGDNVAPVCDGSVHTYVLRVDQLASGEQWDGGPWRQLGFWVASFSSNAEEGESLGPPTIDILSVQVIPKEAPYADAPVGVRDEVRDLISRRTVFTHTPGKLEYRLRTPQDGQFYTDLGVLRKDVPVTFRITVTPLGGDVTTLLEETYSDHLHWAQHSVDLSDFAGRVITLSLEADADRAGTVAFWAAPTVADRRRAERSFADTLVWDTRTPFVNRVDVQDRANWKVVGVIAGKSGTEPAKPRKEEGYSFKGDAVVGNEHQTAVFWSRKGRVIVYSKADSNKERVEFVPLQLKGKLAIITNCRILQSTGDQIALEVHFSAQGTEDQLSAVFSFGKTGIIEITPAENMKGVSLLSPIEYGVIPSFIGDDLIYNPREYPSLATLHLPSDGLFLGLLKGQSNVMVVAWPNREQLIRLELDTKERETGLFESVDFYSDGKSIYLAILDAPGIWHKQELKPSYLEKDVAVKWKRPFPAKWITQLYEAGVRTTFMFRESRQRQWRAAIGYYIYPVWFHGEKACYHLGKKIPVKGESLIYFLERRDVPGLVSSPVDVLKQTLDEKAFENKLALKDRTNLNLLRPGIILDPDDMARYEANDWCPVATCAVTNRLKHIFEAGKEEEKREYVKAGVEDMTYFITQHRRRIDRYMDFADEMMGFLERKGKSNPDLREFINKMKIITQEIPQEYNRLEGNIKTLEYATELAQKTEALTLKKDPTNLPTFVDLSEEWTGMGGAQDDLVREFHTTTRRLFQEAGYSCVNQPKAVEIAEEIRELCEECLNNPSSYEIWPGY